MTVESALKQAGLSLTAAITACAFNYVVWRVDYPHSSWGDTNVADYSMIVLVFVFIAVAALTVQRQRRDHAARNLQIALFSWLCMPPLVAFALWNSHVSARTFLATAWYWTLQPIPIDIAGAFAWERAAASGDPAHGVIFSLLQLATIALVLSAFAIYIDEYRRKELSDNAGQPR